MEGEVLDEDGHGGDQHELEIGKTEVPQHIDRKEGRGDHHGKVHQPGIDHETHKTRVPEIRKKLD